MSFLEYAPAPESTSILKLKSDYGLFIDGEFVEGTGTPFATISPATEKHIATIAHASSADVDRAVASARRAYDTTWSRMSGSDRGKYLFRIARLVQERARELAVAETLDIEQAISQRPDVIILNIEAQHATEDARYIEKLDALGIPVVYVDFRNQPMTNTEPTMRLFGQLFGREQQAEAFIAFRNRQIRRVTDVIAAQKPARPAVFIERIGGYTDDCCLSFGNENFGLFVEMAGGNNIAKGIIPTTFGQLNPEQVIVANPAQVVVTSANWEAFAPGGHWVGVGPGADMAEARRKLAWYTARPAYAGIKAQENQAFHAIWHQFYNSPYQFVAIQQLAKWFHPTLFADLDPEASFRELHERFLPVPYEPGYSVSLKP